MPDYTRLIERIQALRRWGDAQHIILAGERAPAELERRCLEAGADDWVALPLDSKELHTRLRALGRRPCDSPVSSESIRLDENARVLAADGTPVRLTRAQFALVSCLVARHGEWLGTSHLQREALASACREGASNVRYHVHQLRARLMREHPTLARYLHSEPGLGYMWSEAACDRRHCQGTELGAR